MNIVICDDERYFVDLLELRLKKYAAGKDIGLNLQKCYSAQSLLSLDLMGCDAVFLDIDMPGTNGMEAAQALRKRYPKLILVFVTGWIQYAPAGYRVNAFRYLLKERLDDELDSCMDELTEKSFPSMAVTARWRFPFRISCILRARPGGIPCSISTTWTNASNAPESSRTMTSCCPQKASCGCKKATWPTWSTSSK